MSQAPMGATLQEEARPLAPTPEYIDTVLHPLGSNAV